MYWSIKLALNAMNSAEVVDLCHEMVELGFQHVVFHILNTQKIVKSLEIFDNEVIPTITEF